MKVVKIVVVVMWLCLFSSVNIFSQGYSEYDWNEIKHVKGGVKECTITFDYEGKTQKSKTYFDEKGNIIEYQHDTDITNISYDKSGHISEIISSYINVDNNNKVEPNRKKVYQYDTAGHLSEMNSFSFDEKNNKFIPYDKTVYQYDTTGHLSEKICSYFDEESNKFISDYKTAYQYDANGKLKKLINYYAEGEKFKVWGEENIIYDENWKINIDKLCGNAGVCGTNIYNKDFNLIGAINYHYDIQHGFSKKNIKSQETIKYDKDGNISEYVTNYYTVPEEDIENSPIDKLKTVTQKFQYTLDDKGNKIKQVTTVTITPADAELEKLVKEQYPELFRPTITFKYDDEGNKKDTTTTTTNTKENKEGNEEQKKEVLVDWSGQWYPAVILKQEGDKYLIHYVDYDSSWDEWVTSDRIKEKK